MRVVTVLVDDYQRARFTASPPEFRDLANAATAARAVVGSATECFETASVVALATTMAGDPAGFALMERALAAYDPTTASAEAALQAAHLEVLLVHPERVRPLVGPVLAGGSVSEVTRARLLGVVGVSDAWSGALVPGELALREARECARATGQEGLRCEVTGFLAKVEGFRGKLDLAVKHRAEARELAAEIASPWVANGVLEVGVYLSLLAGDLEAHQSGLELMFAESRGLESGLSVEYAYELAHYRALSGDADAARTIMDAVPIVPDWPGAVAWPAWRAWNLALDDPAAWADVEKAATGLVRRTECFLRPRLRWLLGRYHRAKGRRGAAVRLLESAASAYAVTGAAGFVRAVERDLPGSLPHNETAGISDTRLDLLTEAERRVALAVREGMSNRDVASTLFLSVKTVEFHLGHIFRKTGVRSRAELVHWLES